MPTEKRREKAKAKHAGRPRSNQRNLRISIIGAGRLGTALALALARRGYRIEALVARNLKSARRAAALLNADTVALSHAQLKLLPPSDLLFITTPDDTLAQTAASLAALMKDTGRRRKTALHCSGALSSDLLTPLRNAGFRVGSMHPLVSISEPSQGAASLRGAYYCVEGDTAAVRVARSVVRDLEGQSFSINKRDKALYHAAAVMTSGHTVALFDLAQEMLMRCGLTKKKAQAVLLPLLRSTLENLSLKEPSRALTGTFARADAATVRNHLEALRQFPSHDAIEVYKLLGQRSLQLAKNNGASADALEQIALLLAQAARP